MPQAPGDLSWDTHLTIPLGIRTYGLRDLAKSDSSLQAHGSGIGMDTTGLLYFSAFTKVKVPLGDSLIVEPFSATRTKPLGVPDFVGTADLPAQQHRMTQGLVFQGTLTVTLQNQSGGTSASVQVTIPSFTSNSGDTLQLNFTNVSGTPQTVTQDLHNYTVKLDSPPPPAPQSIQLRIHAPVNDRIQMIAELSRLSFINYWGHINGLRIPSLDAGTDVDQLPQGYNAVHPTTVDAFVHMIGNSALDATTVLNLGIQTYLNGGLLATDSVNSNGLGLATDTTVTVHDLAGLVATYPDRLNAGANLTLTGEAHNLSGSDTIHLNVELRSPLSFTMDPLHAPGDSSIRKVDNNELKDVKKDGSKLTIRVWNHLPVGGRVYLVADTVESRVYSTSGADVDTVVNVVIAKPQLDAHGNAVADTLTSFEIELTDAMVDLLKNPPFYTRTDVSLNGSNGDTLVANAGDYVKVQIIAEINRHISTRGND